MTHTLKAGARQIDLSTPVCMGILNITPDSFSDGFELGKLGSDRFIVDIDKALRHAEAMVREGAQFIDVGGESTRPGAVEVTAEEQLDRVLPVIEAIHANLDVCISVDTSSAEVMLAAIAAGAECVNDIRALSEPGTIEVIKKSAVAICLMHMQGVPRTMQTTFVYSNVVDEVLEFLKQKVECCASLGIEKQRMLVDPGFGFGKSPQHNFQLLKNLVLFKQLQLPVLVGLSRKSMIGSATARLVQDRLAGSIAATSYALLGGARIIRTHDVAATMDAIRVNSAYSSA